jgi:protein-S-isoprenylcysteine O-methyltransferase Ste14
VHLSAQHRLCVSAFHSAYYNKPVRVEIVYNRLRPTTTTACSAASNSTTSKSPQYKVIYDRQVLLWCCDQVCCVAFWMIDSVLPLPSCVRSSGVLLVCVCVLTNV